MSMFMFILASVHVEWQKIQNLLDALQFCDALCEENKRLGNVEKWFYVP